MNNICAGGKIIKYKQHETNININAFETNRHLAKGGTYSDKHFFNF